MAGTAPDPQGGEPWPPEPWQGDPWSGGPGQGEQSTSLSPEPWAAPQPEMWHPPPPKRRDNTMTYFVVALGVVLLATVALGIVFWPDDKPAGNAGQTPAGQTNQQTNEASPTDAGNSGGPTPSDVNPDAKEQATQVDSLLTSMMSTRSELGSVVSGGCDTSGLQRIRGQREEQLNTARNLEVDALVNGAQLKSALIKALEISVESNRLYLSYAPGCPDEDAADSVNSRANQAKAEVIQYWNPIATQHGLSTRSSGNI